MNRRESVSAPLVGLTTDTFMKDGHVTHGVGDKYVRAVATAAQAVPVMLPSLGPLMRLPELLQRLDGLVLTGSPSNVHPSLYGVTPTKAHEPYDESRDATSLDLAIMAIDMGVPLLAICRGLQELNVALGGTLQAEVHEVDGRLDHRAPDHPELDVMYGERHRIEIAPGGLLERILGERTIEVNSLHRQAIDRLAPRLRIEATAPDGTIEAVSVPDAKAFALAVQWHPEYRVTDNPQSQRLFEAFGDAVRVRAGAGTGAAGPRLAAVTA